MTAALLAFRGVYYLLPLAVAGIVWLALEIALGRQFLRDVSEQIKAAQAAGHGLHSVAGHDSPKASDCPKCLHNEGR